MSVVPVKGKGLARRLFAPVLRVLGAALLAINVTVTTVAAESVEMISPRDFRSDLSEAYDLLKSFHPNLTAHVSAAELDALFDEISAGHQQPMTRDEAYLALARFIGAVCDEHTQLVIQGADAFRSHGWPWHLYPLMVIDGHLYLESPRSGGKEEVLWIDDVSGLAIAEALVNSSPADGCLGDGTLMVSRGLFLNGAIVMAMIGGTRDFHIVKSRIAGSERVITRLVEATDRLTSAAHRQHEQRRSQRRLESALLTQGLLPQGTSREAERAGISYRYSTERNIVYLDIDRFDAFDVIEDGLDLVMRDVVEKNPDALIVDLVDNPGGTTRSAQLLMAYLLPRAHRMQSRAYMRNVSGTLPDNFAFFDDEAKRSRQHDIRFFRTVKPKRGLRSAPVARKSFGRPDYKGPIYVLVSPGSRSNSVRVAANLRRLRDATIVGSLTATDTTTHCSTASGSFTLEHTGFELRVPDICYRSPENSFNDANTLVPDIEVGVLDAPLEELNARTALAAVEHIGRTLTN